MPLVQLAIFKLFKTLFGSKIASISKKLDDFLSFKVCKNRFVSSFADHTEPASQFGSDNFLLTNFKTLF